MMLALVTAVLVFVTWRYVHLTEGTLSVLQEQLSVIRNDYQVRSYPEMTIFPPYESTQGEEKGMGFIIRNSGFQATDVKVKVIVCYNREPQPDKIGLLYKVGGQPFYVQQEINRLASNSQYEIFITDKNHALTSNLGFLIFVRYNVPLREEPKQDYKYFEWNERLKKWQGYADENIPDIIERVYNKKILDDF